MAFNIAISSASLFSWLQQSLSVTTFSFPLLSVTAGSAAFVSTAFFFFFFFLPLAKAAFLGASSFLSVLAGAAGTGAGVCLAPLVVVAAPPLPFFFFLFFFLSTAAEVTAERDV